jgi:broad specificity phosphatase PhoE
MLTFVLTRHGLTTRSDPEQHLGQKIDVPLSAAGRRQAASLAKRLASAPFDRIISSPLIRAAETAESIAAVDASGVTRPEVELDRRLAEMDYGDWEGLTYEQIDAGFGPERHRWEADPARLSYPNGESGNDVARRVRAVLEDLLADQKSRGGSAAHPAPDRSVLAVAHSSVNRILVCVALGIPVRDFRRRVVQGQVNITALRYQDGDGPADAQLILFNDLEHVRRSPLAPWE